MRSRWSISGPNAFSMRSAISGVSAALAWRRSERVARRTCKIAAAFETLSPSASMTSVRIRSPGCGGFFMGISASSVVIDKVNIAGSIGIFVVAKDQSPVSGNSQAPESLQVTLERMQLPARKSSELIQRFGGLDGQEQLAQFASHRGRHETRIFVLIELAQSFVMKPDKLHDPSILMMYGSTVQVKC